MNENTVRCARCGRNDTRLMLQFIGTTHLPMCENPKPCIDRVYEAVTKSHDIERESLPSNIGTVA